jgi:ribosomal protein S6
MYETVIILDDRKIQDEGNLFVEEFSSKISGAGGEIVKVTSLGRKQFARQIKKRKTGFYWDFLINLDEKEAKRLPGYYSLDERVLRMQTFIYDRPETPISKTTPETAKKEENSTPIVGEKEKAE